MGSYLNLEREMSKSQKSFQRRGFDRVKSKYEIVDYMTCLLIFDS